MRLLPFDHAVRNLGRTPGRTLCAGLGSAVVLALLLGAVGFSRGMNRSLVGSGGIGNVLMLGAGSEESVERSEIPIRAAGVVAASLRGIERVLGEPAVSPEIHAALPVALAEQDAASGLVVVRGTTPMAFAVHPQAALAEGRPAERGRDEAIVGRRVADLVGVESIEVGDRLRIDEIEVEVVGVFDAPGTVMDAEIWMPLADLGVLVQRDSLSCIVLAAADGDPDGRTFAAAQAFAATRLDLELVAMPETDYYARLAAFFTPLRAMIGLAAGLVAVGAALGGLATLHAVFASRIREFATLQVLGWSRGAIVVSMLQEALLLNAAAMLLAAAFAYAVLDGLSIRFSMGLFGISIDGPTMAVAAGGSILLAILGIAMPAVRCLRPPLPEALRDA
jgi:putative ABC transport system permease protein